MEKQIACLVEACDELGLNYELVDKEQNLVRVEFAKGPEYFELNKTPFNSESVFGICLDKMHTFELLKNTLQLPETLAFLDPDTKPEYQQYLDCKSVAEIVAQVELRFSYPVVVKRNKGALGSNVFLCDSAEQLAEAVTLVFDKESYSYDYIALVQPYVDTQVEYRLVSAFGQPMLAYRRGNAAGFNAKYWEHDEQASLIEDGALIDELHQFVSPVFEKLNIGFVGFDIIRDGQNQLHLIELNSSPKFNNIIKGDPVKGHQAVVNMYRSALQMFASRW
ncbi:ATP-grasp domain-containing protein (plasmid) [Pseudoalteromonas sp. T1lg65]|uniref:ATP-grasp domain-containing protein n=1 Tax=Pseudoalteromonas sp. T1lg65 TaxID=2077101 RepID=UPI003F78E028